jgi:hypothetical protein
LSSGRQLFENFGRLIVRRSHGFRGRSHSLPKTLDRQLPDRYAVEMDIDSE